MSFLFFSHSLKASDDKRIKTENLRRKRKILKVVIVRVDLCNIYQKIFHYLETNRSTYRFMSYDWVQMVGACLPPRYRSAAPQAQSFIISMLFFSHQYYVPRQINRASRKKKLNNFSHSFKFITSEIGIKMYLIISDHSLMSWLYLSINNFLNQNPKEKKANNKTVI